MTVVDDWPVQHRVWGWVVLGDVGEQDALLAEGGIAVPGFWDLTDDDLAPCFQEAGDGMGWQRVPDWYALVHLPEEWRETA